MIIAGSRSTLASFGLLIFDLILFGCGGGDDKSPSMSIPSDQQRANAAAQTATTNVACTSIQPFYWEIGDRSVMLTGATSGGATPTNLTQMKIASASKWIFGTYVVQLRNGALTTNDIAALTMRAGYTNLTYGSCIKLLPVNQNAETVHECFAAPSNMSGSNSDFNANNVGKFFYNGGHFQWLADTDLQLGATNNASLKTAIAQQQMTDFAFTYDSPQLAAGVQTTATDYGFFLRKILSNQLRMHDFLGTNAVCTNPMTCSTAVSTPIPSTESWHYSIAHWVEDDPVNGDGSFSSPGAFGFYPWIDASKTYYGILAREAIPLTIGDSIAAESVSCGRLIRKAWLSGTPQ